MFSPLGYLIDLFFVKCFSLTGLNSKCIKIVSLFARFYSNYSSAPPLLLRDEIFCFASHIKYIKYPLLSVLGFRVKKKTLWSCKGICRILPKFFLHFCSFFCISLTIYQKNEQSHVENHIHIKCNRYSIIPNTDNVCDGCFYVGPYFIQITVAWKKIFKEVFLKPAPFF